MTRPTEQQGPLHQPPAILDDMAVRCAVCKSAKAHCADCLQAVLGGPCCVAWATAVSSGPTAGELEVGVNGRGDVVINHPDLQPDAAGVGHIVFSPAQARALAATLARKADEAEGVVTPGMVPTANVVNRKQRKKR